MNAKVTVSTILGAIGCFLGMVCFVQGLGIIQIALVMCVADCEPITGKSVQWTVIGVIDSFVGIGFVWAGQRRVNR